MLVNGKIIQVLPERSGEGEHGTWRRGGFVLEILGSFVRRIAFDVSGAKCDTLKVEVGKFYNIEFDINANERGGRWWNTLNAWRAVETNEAGQVVSSAAEAAPAPETKAESVDWDEIQNSK